MIGLDRRPLSQGEVRHARHGFYAAVSYVDERIGEVLGALAATGLEQSTLVVFTADHGEMLGERGLWYKMTFLEGSSRVPLIVRGPGLTARRVHAPVSQLDLAPTLAELAQAPAAGAEFEGSSLVGALPGESGGPAEALGEYLAEGVQAPAVMIRRDRHKYIRCPGDPDLLYDLANDPLELRNLAANPDGTALVAAFRAESDELWDLGALEQRVRESQRARHLVARALERGAYAPWDFQPYTDASIQYVRSEAARGSRPGAPGRRAGSRPAAATSHQTALDERRVHFFPPAACDRHRSWMERGRRPRRMVPGPCQLPSSRESLCLIRFLDGDFGAPARSPSRSGARRSQCLPQRWPTASSTRASTAPASTWAPPARA